MHPLAERQDYRLSLVVAVSTFAGAVISAMLVNRLGHAGKPAKVQDVGGGTAVAASLTSRAGVEVGRGWQKQTETMISALASARSEINVRAALRAGSHRGQRLINRNSALDKSLAAVRSLVSSLESERDRLRSQLVC